MWKMEGTLPREAGTPAYIGGTLHASSRPAAKYLQKINPDTRHSQETNVQNRGNPSMPEQKSLGTPVKYGGNPFIEKEGPRGPL